MKTLIALLFLCCMTFGLSAETLTNHSKAVSHKAHHPGKKKGAKTRAHMAKKVLRSQR
jgi:hypothetical protein